MNYYIGIDIGGTNIKTAILDGSNKIIAFNSTPTDPAAIAKTAANAVYELCRSNGILADEICSIGAGIPGLIDGPKGPVFYTPNLPMKGLDLVGELAVSFKELAFPIDASFMFLANDADCAGVAENVLGAGKDSGFMLMLTLGTGLGGCAIKDGKPLPLGRYGGEFGHIPFIPGGKECPCGLKGCLEQYTNAAAFKEFGFGLYTDYLSSAIAGFINIFRPDIVVLAGGVTNQGAPLFDALNEKMRAVVYGHGMIEPPAIIPSVLGPDAGAVGAALFGKHSL